MGLPLCVHVCVCVHACACGSRNSKASQLLCYKVVSALPPGIRLCVQTRLFCQFDSPEGTATVLREVSCALCGSVSPGASSRGAGSD